VLKGLVWFDLHVIFKPFLILNLNNKHCVVFFNEVKVIYAKNTH